MAGRIAGEHGMWIAGCQYELDGEDLWNTAYLIDPGGAIAGRYRKVHEAEVYRCEHDILTLAGARAIGNAVFVARSSGARASTAA